MASVDAAVMDESEAGAESQGNGDVLAVGQPKSQHRQQQHHALVEDQRSEHRKRKSSISVGRLQVFPLVDPGSDSQVRVPPQGVLDENLGIAQDIP